MFSLRSFVTRHEPSSPIVTAGVDKDFESHPLLQPPTGAGEESRFKLVLKAKSMNQSLLAMWVVYES